MGRLCRNPCRDLCRSRVKRECGRIGVGVPASAVLVHLLFHSNLVSNPGLACTSTCTRTNGNTPHALLGGAGRRRGGTDLLAKHFPQGRAGPARRRATRRSRVGTPQRRAARARHGWRGAILCTRGGGKGLPPPTPFARQVGRDRRAFIIIWKMCSRLWRDGFGRASRVRYGWRGAIPCFCGGDAAATPNIRQGSATTAPDSHGSLLRTVFASCSSLQRSGVTR